MKRSMAGRIQHIIYHAWFAFALAAGFCGVSTGKAQPQPVSLSVFHPFSHSDIQNPQGELVPGAGNILYGTAPDSGSSGNGGVFKVNRDGSGYAVLHNFSLAENESVEEGSLYPGPSVIQGAGGLLYGTTSMGANYPNGLVYKMNTDGSGFAVLHSFGITDDSPSGLIQASDGMLYGAGVTAIFKLAPDGSQYTALHVFNDATDGDAVFGRLVQGIDGALYGATYYGGTNGHGTVFKLNTDGSSFTVLHTFTGNPDGAAPRGSLIQGNDGALYGTTVSGGTNNEGTIFKLNTDGTGYQVLYNFLANGTDGNKPEGALVEGLGNMIYGTTAGGGTNGVGTIFEIGANGSNYVVLYNFINSLTGIQPYAGLVQGPASDGSGVLYGATSAGSSVGTNEAGGAIFAVVVNPPLSITPVVGQTGGSPVVVWPAWALNYVLQTTTNLANPAAWTTATNGVPATAFIITNSTPGAYYRLIWHQ